MIHSRKCMTFAPLDFQVLGMSILFWRFFLIYCIPRCSPSWIFYHNLCMHTLTCPSLAQIYRVRPNQTLCPLSRQLRCYLMEPILKFSTGLQSKIWGLVSACAAFVLVSKMGKWLVQQANYDRQDLPFPSIIHIHTLTHTCIYTYTQANIYLYTYKLGR